MTTTSTYKGHTITRTRMTTDVSRSCPNKPLAYYRAVAPIYAVEGPALNAPMDRRITSIARAKEAINTAIVLREHQAA